jgi:hypothetical protein
VIKIVNISKDPYDVYIGRNKEYGNPKFGNPFRVEKYGRKGAIQEYKNWISVKLALNTDLQDEFLELDGKVLGCHCKPKSCHGDVIVELIENIKRRRRIAYETTL